MSSLFHHMLRGFPTSSDLPEGMDIPETRRYFEHMRREVVYWLDYYRRPRSLPQYLLPKRDDIMGKYFGRFDTISIPALTAPMQLDLRVALHELHTLVRDHSEYIEVDLFRQRAFHLHELRRTSSQQG